MRIIKKFNLNKSPFLLFSPFLILYIVFILIFSKSENSGDEIRYITYVHNLMQGFYSHPYPYIDLGNGPGYPLILLPFVVLKASLILLKLLNALFYYLSIIFLYKSLKQIVSFRFSLVFSLIWALYPNTFEQMSYMLPEVFSTSLIPLLLFSILNAFNGDTLKKRRKYVIIAGLTFGYLALTKPIFGYVLIFMIMAMLLLWITNRKNLAYKKTIIILIISFIAATPYLLYTYNLTGKIFYWSSFGGNNLYWMSNPYNNEYGEYFNYPFHARDYAMPGSEDSIKLHHQKDFDYLLKNPEVRKANILNGVVRSDLSNGTTQDDLLKKIAFENIKSHPIKFLQNCFSNTGRMLFNYPGSYILQKPSTLRRLPVNGTLILFCLFCFIPTFVNWKKVLFPVRLLLFFSLLYFGGSMLGSAEPRMFTVIVPILLFWIAYILERTVKVKLKFNIV
jgi:4-amino-4-deoxy-L-arabinose transferase-like glycosyltransferase